MLLFLLATSLLSVLCSLVDIYLELLFSFHADILFCVSTCEVLLFIANLSKTVILLQKTSVNK